MAKIEMYSSAWCPYCIRARRLLDGKGVEYAVLSIDGAPEVRAQMMARSDAHTVPQIFIGGTHVGGCDELVALERSGALDRLLAEA